MGLVRGGSPASPSRPAEQTGKGRTSTISSGLVLHAVYDGLDVPARDDGDWELVQRLESRWRTLLRLLAVLVSARAGEVAGSLDKAFLAHVAFACFQVFRFHQVAQRHGVL